MLLGKLIHRQTRSRLRYRKQVHLHAVKDLKRRFFMLAMVVAVHSIAMVYFEDLDWWQAFWLTMTSASTTGYGDISAATFWGQFATIVLIYGMGITLLAQIASDYVEIRIMRKEMKIKGRLEWSDMQDHLLIINTPSTNTERYLSLMVQQICNTPGLDDVPIQILTPKFPEGLPETLRAKGVVHHTGDATSPGMLNNAGVANAKYIVVLSPDSLNAHSDSLVFDTLHRIQEIGTKAFILAEAIDDANRQRFREAGAKAVIRPIRAYPEMLVRSIVAPGTEQVLEDLFRYQGDHTVRINVSLYDVRWADVVTQLIQRDMGTAIGFEDTMGNIVTHPKSSEHISLNALILLIGEDQVTPTGEEVKVLLAPKN